MKIRIKFAKQGPMKFIGHLDIMRYFQKAMRRGNIDICYSEGFSPHQIMSFASPLGVGLTSNGEYMDIEVSGTTNSKEMTNQLNSVMVDGMKVLSCRRLNDTAKNAMSIVAAADYTIRFREGCEPADLDDYFSGLSDFYKMESIRIIKKTKKGEQEVDIRPFIYCLSVKDNTIFMQLSSGSANNLKPELVLEAYTNFRGGEFRSIAFQIQREELYAADENGKLISLEDLGEEFE
ncbi:MAG: TIGR03936 family radical SAM-associated protein [Clostridiaceae bacterium]|nr:TIGR03936 family radical SAM-associated protein [Clostridiaceae bacterium]